MAGRVEILSEALLVHPWRESCSDSCGSPIMKPSTSISQHCTARLVSSSLRPPSLASITQAGLTICTLLPSISHVVAEQTASSSCHPRGGGTDTLARFRWRDLPSAASAIRWRDALSRACCACSCTFRITLSLRPRPLTLSRICVRSSLTRAVTEVIRWAIRLLGSSVPSGAVARLIIDAILLCMACSYAAMLPALCAHVFCSNCSALGRTWDSLVAPVTCCSIEVSSAASWTRKADVSCAIAA
mmetsp:Transcript_41201/g.68542  ORF Transcript_41201/g.68542 Transcript_41201/m.68542 type:complete len:244 (-) Transcript_41201:17-748(-)